jgi:hypothetical protein
MSDNTQKKTKKQDTPSNLYEAMLAFQSLSVAAVKSGKNPAFKSNYATLEAVIEAVDQAHQFGLCFMQHIEYDKGEDGNTLAYVRTVVIHAPSGETNDQTVVPIYLGKAHNPMQALGSGITYAKRYGLQSAFGLPSEDDDANSTNVNGGTPVVTQTTEW